MEQNPANLKNLIAEYHDIILCYYDYWSHIKPIVEAKIQTTNLLESYRRDEVPDAKRIAELEKKLKELAIEDNKVHEELKRLVGQYEQGQQRLPRLLKEMDSTTGSRMPSFRFYDQEKRSLEYNIVILDSVANRNHSRKDRGSLIENLMEQQEEYFKKIGKANPARLTQPGQGETPGAGGEGKPAHQWRLAVKGTGQKEETTQSPKPTFTEILSILGNIASIFALPLTIIGLLFSPQDVIDLVKDAGVVPIVGFLGPIATLILFYVWLRNKS